MKLKLHILILILISIFNGCNSNKNIITQIKDNKESSEIILKESKNQKNLIMNMKNGQKINVGICENSKENTFISPNKKITLIKYQKNCGAAVNYSTHIIALHKNDKIIVAIFEGKPNISIRWIDNKKVKIEHSNIDNKLIFKKKNNILNIKVLYIPKKDAYKPIDSKTLNFSNLNFGTTGRAANISKETLMRIAGWHQKASGLYKKEWGNWNGKPPYGDDKEGHEFIKLGIQYFEMKN